MDPMEEDRVFYKSNDVKLNIDKHTLGLGCLIISERYTNDFNSMFSKLIK